MIAMQISAYPGSGMARRFQSTPEMAARVPAVMMRLRMDAARDEVENRERDGEACYRGDEAQKTARIENSLAHGVKHSRSSPEAQRG